MMTLRILLPIVVLLLAPLLLVRALKRAAQRTRLEGMLSLMAAVAFVASSALWGRWDWPSYYLRAFWPAALLVVFYRSWVAARSRPFFRKPSLRGGLTMLVNILIIMLFAPLAVWAIRGYLPEGRPVGLSFPLKDGIYVVGQGGSTAIVNGHHEDRAQKYALDIVRLNWFGGRASGMSPKDLTRYAIFGDTIYSPCGGRVMVAVDGFPDLTPPQRDPRNAAGNHVVLECKEVRVFLAHLMRSSVLVGGGDLVKEGQPLGKVGNSGNTSEPHLHIHAVRGDHRRGEGVPILFAGRFLVRNSVVFGRR